MSQLALPSVDDLIAKARAAGEPLPGLDDEARFAGFFDRFADASIVLLGECTHGTSEFYRARAIITQHLIAKHGFRIVAIEGDWPDAAELDRFVRQHGKWGERSAFVNFPRWMWRNVEFAQFLYGLRSWNDQRPIDDRAEIRGLDLYSMHRSVDEVLTYLDRVDPFGAHAGATALWLSLALFGDAASLRRPRRTIRRELRGHGGGAAGGAFGGASSL